MHAPSCDNIAIKCQMRVRLQDVYEHRHTKNTLGSLGPCTFSTIDRFLQQPFIQQQTIYKCGHFRRVVAIGDIHGDFLSLLSTLFMMKVIDINCNWIGGNTMVVQCGDFIDRTGRPSTVNTSHNPREEVDIIQYIHALHTIARKQRGGVISLLGNHELHHVFGTDNSRWNDDLLVQGWGGTAHKQMLFQPNHPMATYLSARCPLILQIGNFLYMHGGIHMTILKKLRVKTIDDLNSQMRLLLRGHQTSPENSRYLLYIVNDRSLADSSLTDDLCVERLQKVFQYLGMELKYGGIIIGHTVQDTLEPYCNGHVWRIDLALSEAFGTPTKLGAIVIKCATRRSLVCTKVYTKDTIVSKVYENGAYRQTNTSVYDVTMLKKKYNHMIKQ